MLFEVLEIKEHYIFHHDNDGFIDKYVIINPYGDEEYKALRKVKV